MKLPKSLARRITPFTYLREVIEQPIFEDNISLLRYGKTINPKAYDRKCRDART